VTGREGLSRALRELVEDAEVCAVGSPFLEDRYSKTLLRYGFSSSGIGVAGRLEGGRPVGVEGGALFLPFLGGVVSMNNEV
jgi:hypothetical protein